LRVATLLTALALLLAAPAALGQDGGPESWYTQRMTIGPGPVLLEQLWSKGPLLRALAVVRGRPVLTLVDRERYVIIDQVGRKGVSIERSPRAVAQDATRGRPFGTESARLDKMKAERVGDDVVAGQEVEHLRVTDRRGREELWVTLDMDRLPVRYTRWDRTTRVEIQYSYLDWARGIELPDSFFQPPADFTIERIGYDDYVTRSKTEPVGPAPPFFASLLHGVRDQD